MNIIEAILTAKKVDFHGLEIVNPDYLFILLSRFLMNLGFAYIVVKKLYYDVKKRSDTTNKKIEYFFTFLIFNILLFFIASLLADTKLKMEAAFGLFAIFSILRYRTLPLEIKEMTFLFISIAIAVVNSMVTSQIGIVEIILTNCIIVLTTWIMEKKWVSMYMASVPIKYEKIELTSADRRSDLIADLKERTGLNIVDVKTENINFLQDTADLIAFYEEK